VLIKVCCIQDEDELEMAVEAGASHVGLVAEMPSGLGPIPDSDIRRIAAAAPSRVTTVLLTSRVSPEAIVEHVRTAGTRAVQLVRHLPAEVRMNVRAALPDVVVVQVVHVEGPSSVAVAREAAVGADFLLLDSGRPAAATPELGGTGRTHDWAVSAAIVAECPVPVFLAGGLAPTNVRAAIDSVGPAGVDVCSGLRDGAGRLVRASLAGFVRRVRGA
jgi:phosphoribosylanthranilate isomerase